MILRTDGLTKVFDTGFFRRRKVHAVRDLSLTVAEGEIFGFVGPNGAGKTTTIKMLMGLIFPTSGSAHIFDARIPSRAARASIGYLPENPSYFEFLTGREALRLYARLAGVARADAERRCDELLDLVAIGEAADRQIRKYSKGMQQRLGIAQALVADPAFVVLDEPMSGLDPAGRKEMRDLILELKRRGKTVFFSTHILGDVEALCDRVGVIMEGALQDAGRIGELLSPRVRSVEIAAVVPEGAREALGRGRLVAREGDRLTVAFDGEQAADAALRALVLGGAQVVSVTPHRETLEDFFMRRLGDVGAAAAGEKRHVG